MNKWKQITAMSLSVMLIGANTPMTALADDTSAVTEATQTGETDYEAEIVDLITEPTAASSENETAAITEIGTNVPLPEGNSEEISESMEVDQLLQADDRIIASGTCGADLTWTLTNSKVLTISGTGPMDSFENDTPPWFSYRQEILSVVLENGITSISKHAFLAFTSLKSITLPDSITTIESYAFSGCDFTNLILPDSVKNIGNGAFASCNSLESVVLPNGITNIAASVFMYCPNLTTVTIPDSITSVDESAFNGCTSLTQITIPNSVTHIGANAFRSCSSLTGITIPDSVTTIDHQAFYGCSGLTSITIPDSVSEISYEAFYDCSSLTSITIPNDDIHFESSVFHNCTAITSCDQIHLTGDTDTYFCPALRAVLSGSSITSFVFPEGTKSIPDDALNRCSNLTSIIIPDSVTNIGENAFSGCSSLTSITIPDSVVSIGSGAFSYCSGLTSITIPDAVTSIESSTFMNCTGLTNIFLPNTLTYIGSNAFYACAGLTNLTIPDGVTNIGRYTFQNCSGLTSITIPDSVTYIGEYAFNNCSGLTNLTIPDSVTRIERCAFRNCSGLTSVTVPDKISSIGSSAFDGCSSLTSSAQITISGCDDAYPCTSLKKILQESEIKTVEIPEGVTRLGSYMFGGNGKITSITIPSSVTNIEKNAFSGCYGLTDIFYEDSELQWNKNNFNEAVPTQINVHFGKEDYPLLVSAVNAEKGVTLCWHSVNAVENYRIFYKKGSEPWQKYDDVLTTSTLCEATITGLTSGEQYTFTVQGLTSDGQTPMDETGISIQYLETPDQPIITESACTASGITVSWEAVKGAARYKVFYHDQNNDTWINAGDTTDTCYTVTGLEQGKTYTLSVQSISEYDIASPLTLNGSTAIDYILHATAIQLDNSAIELVTFDANSNNTEKAEKQLTATVLPENAANKNVIWRSSDESVATVDANGLVKALRYGTAIITAETEDGGYTSTCNVTTRFYDGVEGVTDGSNTITKNIAASINWMADQGITTGYDKVNFGSFRTTSRADFVIFLWRYAGKPNANTSNLKKFSDIEGKFGKSTATYQAIAWASSNGIINGYSDGTFKPTASVTRGQVAIMLWKFAGQPGVTTGAKTFKDVKIDTKSGVTANMVKAINWASSNKLVNGYNTGKFEPSGSCLRFQMSVIIYRYNNNIGK
ncbi:MAG: leucine-rich repeat protein [Eubacteriales bacterium]|nr:leucine-rich repeat protein [Eubacteriales bacterium]